MERRSTQQIALLLLGDAGDDGFPLLLFLLLLSKHPALADATTGRMSAASATFLSPSPPLFYPFPEM